MHTRYLGCNIDFGRAGLVPAAPPAAAAQPPAVPLRPAASPGRRLGCRAASAGAAHLLFGGVACARVDGGVEAGQAAAAVGGVRELQGEQRGGGRGLVRGAGRAEVHGERARRTAAGKPQPLPPVRLLLPALTAASPHLLHLLLVESEVAADGRRGGGGEAQVRAHRGRRASGQKARAAMLRSRGGSHAEVQRDVWSLAELLQHPPHHSPQRTRALHVRVVPACGKQIPPQSPLLTCPGTPKHPQCP